MMKNILFLESAIPQKKMQSIVFTPSSHLDLHISYFSACSLISFSYTLSTLNIAVFLEYSPHFTSRGFNHKNVILEVTISTPFFGSL